MTEDIFTPGETQSRDIDNPVSYRQAEIHFHSFVETIKPHGNLKDFLRFDEGLSCIFTSSARQHAPIEISLFEKCYLELTNEDKLPFIETYFIPIIKSQAPRTVFLARLRKILDKKG
ncbi:MAG: hypothetical protein WC774_00695 [Candidatus Gracilibacteria bacterium]|jgi:hypothetical protein